MQIPCALETCDMSDNDPPWLKHSMMYKEAFCKKLGAPTYEHVWGEVIA